MPDESTKRSPRQYHRRSDKEILIDRRDKLKSALEKGRQRVDEDEKGLQKVESEIADLNRKARSETRDRQAPLIGLVIMHRMREDPKTRSNVARLLDLFLTTAEDRAVFGLKSLTREERKRRSGFKPDDVEPFKEKELREARSASQPRSVPERSSDGSDSQTGQKHDRDRTQSAP